MFQFIPHDLKVDFLKISKPFVITSTVLVVASIIAIFKPGLNYGIDFTGGAEVQIKVPADWDIAKIRHDLEAGEVKDAAVIQLGDAKDGEFLVKVPASESAIKAIGEQVENTLKPKANGGRFEVTRVDVVGPQAGEELRLSALVSILMAALGILIYITFRFDFRFAPGIVRALLFDVILTLGIWIAIGKEFNLNTVAALLTVAGYSCNDTIVIYDRIRDYSKFHANMSLYDVVNKSINLNLGRTILTVLCTNFVVVSLWLLGGPVIGDFALCMLIGFSISVFSTIFVANPMVMYMEKRRVNKQALA